MITIILPEWLAYLIGIAAVTYVIGDILKLYLWWLNHKLKKLRERIQNEVKGDV